MSKITLEPNSSGAGTFSIVSPDSNTNRTLTLGDESGTIATIENIPPGYEDQDALDLFNVTGSAPVFACRAWVNFDGTDQRIRDSGNVSSITDDGTGRYIVNFATAMPDSNFCVSGTQDNFAMQNAGVEYSVLTSLSARLLTKDFSSNSRIDANSVSVAIFR